MILFLQLVIGIPGTVFAPHLLNPSDAPRPFAAIDWLDSDGISNYLENVGEFDCGR